MTTPLTALERDLLACVERLVTASEASAKSLTALEARSTRRIDAQLISLSECVTLLLRSQTASMAALQGLLSDGANYKELQRQLSESLAQAKAAEKRLRRS